METTDVSSDLVEQALATFYHGPPEQHQAANSWLTSVQISPSAWTFCWDLLRRDGQTEMQFFGACTLHVKLSRFWKELPPEKYDEIKDRTLMEISRFLRSPAPKMIFSKLCAALAVFAIQTCPDIWPDTVRSLVASLEDPKLELSPSESQLAILEVLTVLPEEFPAVHVEQFRRSLIRNELSAKGSPFVLQILESLFTTCQKAPTEEQQNLTNQCVSGMKCLSSWIVLGLPMESMRPIFPHLFAAIRSEPLFESAADALVHVAGHPDMNKYPTVVNELIASILGLNDLLQQALQSQDADSALSLGRIVITLAETNTSHLLDCLLQEDAVPHSPASSSPSSSTPGVGRNAFNFISMILACSGAPGYYGVDELVSELPFGFWYSFQDEIVSANEDKRATLMVKAQSIYMALIEVFLVKVRFPADSEFDEWSCEEKEQFRCYRQDISDTIVYAYNVLGESLLVAFVNALNSLVTSNGPWQNVEAVLFLFSATSEGVERRFSQNVEVLLRMLPMMPVMTERRLVSTVLHLIGGFAEWLSAHPQPIVSLAPLLLEALRQPTLLEPASFALKDLCRESKRHLVPVASDILHAAHEALQNPAVKNRDKVRLMATCGYIFSAMPPSAVMPHLDTLLTPHVNQLVQIASSTTNNATSSTSAATQQGLAPPAEKELILCKLDMLGSLYTTISSSMGEDEEGEEEASEDEASYHLAHGGNGGDPSNPGHFRNHPPTETHATTILAIQGQIQELLQKLLAKYLRDASVVEAVCELLHRCCKALMGEFGPLVDGTARLVGDMYNAAPQGSMLTLANQLTLVYHRETAHVTAIADMFRLVCAKSVSLFQTTTTNANHSSTSPVIRDLPDVAEAFFRYLSMVFRKCPALVQYCVRNGDGNSTTNGGANTASSSSPPMDLTPLIHCGIVGLKLPENPTVKAACGFFVEFVSQSSSGGVSACQRVLADQGLVILEATLTAIAGEAPRTLNDVMADVVFAFARNQVEMTRRWLEALLIERQGFPNPKVTRQQKDHFVKMVLKSNKRRVKEIVKEFSLICRGLVGTEYGMGQQRIDQFF